MRNLLGWMYGEFWNGRGALGLLILRVFIGVAMMLHGWTKVFRNGDFVMFSWMNRPGQNGPPAILQGLAAFSEFGGGLALALGLLTPLAAFGIACTMAYATLVAHGKDPFMGMNQRGKPYVPSKELAMTYLSMAILLMLAGPGRFSLDWLLFGAARGVRGSRMRRV